jgi:hypothetical protein
MDPENEKLFQQTSGEVLISPLILGHIVAHVALRRDLNVVFDELFTAGGAEIYFRASEVYQLGNKDLTFREIERAVALQGDVALGVRNRARSEETFSGIQLNPPKDSLWHLDDLHELVILSTYS